jgi:hypothetical protein
MRNSQYLPPFPLGALRSPDEPIGQPTSPMTDVRFGHDFSRIRVWPKNETPDSSTTVNSLTVGKKLSTQPYSTNQSQSNGPTVHAISASGFTGTVYTSYTPEKADKSTKIVFIQVMRELLDGVPVKPSVASPDFRYQDADTTSDFQHVDCGRGDKDPYYNGDDPRDIGKQGNAISKPPITASTEDAPKYDDGIFPPGKTNLLYEFRTAAFSAAGADQGTYYAYSDWFYWKFKGGAGANALVGTNTGDPGSKFTDAVKLWNSQHGFTMPTKGGS